MWHFEKNLECFCDYKCNYVSKSRQTLYYWIPVGMLWKQVTRNDDFVSDTSFSKN